MHVIVELLDRAMRPEDESLTLDAVSGSARPNNLKAHLGDG